MVGVFAATDVFLFYVFFEAMLIPIYFLIGGFGGAAAGPYAAVKFLLYSLVGGLLMLAAVIGLYVVSADAGAARRSCSPSLPQLDIGTEHRTLAVPRLLHRLRDQGAAVAGAHLAARRRRARRTPGTAVLLVGVLDKVGTFGMMRFCLGCSPRRRSGRRRWCIVLAVIAILYGALLAIGQNDIKRLIAYTSISPLRLHRAGHLRVHHARASPASTLYMVNHGFSTAALFLVAGFLIVAPRLAADRRLRRRREGRPVLAGIFLVAGLAVAVAARACRRSSPSSWCWSARSRATRWSAVVAHRGIVLAALYILLMYQRTMTGPVDRRSPSAAATCNAARDRRASRRCSR